MAIRWRFDFSRVFKGILNTYFHWKSSFSNRIINKIVKIISWLKCSRFCHIWWNNDAHHGILWIVEVLYSWDSGPKRRCEIEREWMRETGGSISIDRLQGILFKPNKLRSWDMFSKHISNSYFAMPHCFLLIFIGYVMGVCIIF